MILKVDDGELYYETEIEIETEGAPCLVPVPGYQGYLTRTLSESLRQRFQFHFLHMCGNGRSDGFSLEQVALDRVFDDFQALRANLCLE
jgi:hypothetical protein